MRSPAFEAWVAEAKAVSMGEAVAPYRARLKRHGRELSGPCPACGGTDRFSVNLAKGVFNCRGGGRGGDAIEMIEYLEGVDFLRACEILTGRPRPDGRGETDEERTERERVRAERRHASEAETRRRAEVEAGYREEERKRCRRLWDDARPLAGSEAERYLERRGLLSPPAACLRYLPAHDLYGSAPAGQRAPLLHRGPAMVAAIAGPDGRFAGLHATWIDLDAPDGKARVPDPATGEFVPARKARGSVMGGRIELVRHPEPSTLYVGEGIETVLSVWRALDRVGQVWAGTAFWASVSLGNLAGRAADRAAHPSDRILRTDGKDGGPRRVPGATPDLASPAIAIPESVRELILLGDGDSEAFATGLALERAARRHARRDGGRPRLVRIAMAPAGQDFNDLLRTPCQPPASNPDGTGSVSLRSAA